MKDLTTVVLGERVAMPIGISPTAMQRMAHPEGECANVRGKFHIILFNFDLMFIIHQSLFHDQVKPQNVTKINLTSYVFTIMSFQLIDLLSYIVIKCKSNCIY